MKRLKMTVWAVLTAACMDSSRADMWTTNDFPGAIATKAFGISGNAIVGGYRDTSGHDWPYESDATGYHKLGFALGTGWSEATGISGNAIIGSYADMPGAPIGYYSADSIDLDSTFSEGSLWTYAAGISVTAAYGTLALGTFADPYGIHGFLQDLADPDNQMTLDMPGASETHAIGLSGTKIWGWFADALGIHGFSYDMTAQAWTAYDAPEATETKFLGVSEYYMLGELTDAAGKIHGLIYDGNTWKQVDAPNAIETHITGMDGDTIICWDVENATTNALITNALSCLITDAIEPVITNQPAACQSVAIGSTVQFSVSAANSPTSWQWFFGTNTLLGATNSTLTLTNVQSPQGGTYTVVVSNPSGAVTSSPSVLNVLPGLNISIVPIPRFAIAGEIGKTYELEYKDMGEPTNAWQELAIVTLTNYGEIYYDTSADGQPQRCYKIAPVH